MIESNEFHRLTEQLEVSQMKALSNGLGLGELVAPSTKSRLLRAEFALHAERNFGSERKEAFEKISQQDHPVVMASQEIWRRFDERDATLVQKIMKFIFAVGMDVLFLVISIVGGLAIAREILNATGLHDGVNKSLTDFIRDVSGGASSFEMIASFSLVAAFYAACFVLFAGATPGAMISGLRRMKVGRHTNQQIRVSSSAS